jgi:sulfite reductase beta subunit-like hemoprotein
MSRCGPQRTDGDRCPGILALHRAEDGLLARIRLAGGRVSASQLEAVAAAAEVGSGLCEITGRANLQVRGLPEGIESRLAELLEAAGLLPSAPHDRARNILASPLAGRHPDSLAAVDGLVEEIDRGIIAGPELAELPGRFLFLVDDGSGLARRDADLTLVATGRGEFELLVAGVPAGDGFGAGEGVDAALRAARAFLELRERAGGRAWHMRELPEGAARITAAIGLPATGEQPSPAQADPLSPGPLTQNDGRVALTALAPLGRLERETLAALAALLAAHDAEARLSPWRTLTVPDLSRSAAKRLAGELEGLELIVEPNSGWVGLSACAGLGYCAKARVDVRAQAARRAAVRRPGAPAEHLAACERGCGAPQRAP